MASLDPNVIHAGARLAKGGVGAGKNIKKTANLAKPEPPPPPVKLW